MVLEMVSGIGLNQGRMLVARMSYGTDLLEGIEALCQENEIDSAIIISCYGSLKDVCFNHITQEEGENLGALPSKNHTLPGPIQLLTGQGMVGVDKETGELFTHLHATFGDKLSHIYGGHLISGHNPVLRTVEVALLESSDVKMIRDYNEKTQSKQLFFR